MSRARPRSQRFVVLTPDELPIQPHPFASRNAAEEALKQWAERFKPQGYYLTARWERIAVADLPLHCEIVPAEDTLCV